MKILGCILYSDTKNNAAGWHYTKRIGWRMDASDRFQQPAWRSNRFIPLENTHLQMAKKVDGTQQWKENFLPPPGSEFRLSTRRTPNVFCTQKCAKTNEADEGKNMPKATEQLQLRKFIQHHWQNNSLKKHFSPPLHSLLQENDQHVSPKRFHNRKAAFSRSRMTPCVFPLSHYRESTDQSSRELHGGKER